MASKMNKIKFPRFRTGFYLIYLGLKYMVSRNPKEIEKYLFKGLSLRVNRMEAKDKKECLDYQKKVTRWKLDKL